MGGDGTSFHQKLLTISLLTLPAAWLYQHQMGLQTDLDVPEVPMEVQQFTLEDLSMYTGQTDRGDGASMLLAVWGRVFNVTNAPEFYKEGEQYSLFVGYDCTHAFAIQKTKKSLRNKDLSELTDKQIAHLNETYWDTYVYKYPIVGSVMDPPYNPSDYDHLAGSFANVASEILASKIRHSGVAPKRKRESKCPITKENLAKAARLIAKAVASFGGRLLLGPPSDAESPPEPEAFEG